MSQTLENGPLAGRKALVTGATRGIGRAIAEKLVAAGAEVFGTGTTPGADVPVGVSHLAVDFSDAQATKDFAATLADLAPDILVNNAGINIVSPFAEIDPDDFARVQQVNVTAPFLLCQAAIGPMKAKGWGRIINISSIWGKISKANRGAYGASKFALDGMTASLAAEVAPFGILANCIAPGFIDTDLTRKTLGPKVMEELAAQVPMGRLGKPEEIAALAAWLAGPENTYISGQNIAIDGGFTRV